MIGKDDGPSAAVAWLEDIAAAIAFFTRLPVYAAAGRRPPFAMKRAARAAPIAGAVVGLIVALSLAAVVWVGLTGFLGALFAVAVGIMITGALHEDGLADTADGFGGGWTTAARLDIMRDSRLGTYGALALLLSVLARIGALAGILDRGGLVAAMLIIVGAEAVSRAAAIWMIWALPPVRPGGAAASAGPPASAAAFQCFVVAAAIACITTTIAAGVLAAIFALAAAALATLAMIAVASRRLGGQTGDVAGAAQQAALIAFLVAGLAALPM